VRAAIRRLPILVAALSVCVLMIVSVVGVQGAPTVPLDITPTAFVYLPVIYDLGYSCPATSSHQYDQGIAYQFDEDDPVRPAWNHADKNLALRGYTATTPARQELVSYGSDDPTQPPQFATLFSPNKVPPLVGFYQVHHWNWSPSPDPGTRGTPITAPDVTGLGLGTLPGEVLYVPESGYNIGGNPPMEVLVLFADEDSIALRYTREDSSGSPGYTVHIDNICTDPNLLALYNALDNPGGPRYQYPNPSYNLPNLPAGKPIGTARGTEVVVAITDTGTFMDPRSCNEWWQIRPGYTGSCPPP
jgi:hypothetical protein